MQHKKIDLFCFIWKCDSLAWLSWAISNNIEQKVIEFISTFPEYLLSRKRVSRQEQHLEVMNVFLKAIRFIEKIVIQFLKEYF